MKLAIALLLSLSIWGQGARSASVKLLLADTDAPNTPTDSPGGGTYGSTQSVTLSDATAQFILYTADGSTPACPGTGTLYTGAISVSVTTTIKAVGCNGITGGGVLTSVYTISGGSGATIIAHACYGLGPNGGTTSPALNAAGGNFIYFSAILNSNYTTAPSDSSSNSYTAGTTQSVNSFNPLITTFYAKNATTTSSMTWTFSHTSIFAGVCVQVWSGMDTTSPATGQFSSSTTTATTIQAGSITPPSQKVVVFTTFGANQNHAYSSVDSGITNVDSLTYNSGNWYVSALGSLVQATGTAINPTWTAASSGILGAVNDAYKSQ